MDNLLLQDWLTLRGTVSSIQITQSVDGWLDLAPYEDVIFFLDVSEKTGAAAINMRYETAPTREDLSFMPVVVPFAVAVTTAAPRVDRVLVATALTPVARWVRWKLSTSEQSWDVTFRVRIAAYAFGRKEDPWTPCSCSRG